MDTPPEQAARILAIVVALVLGVVLGMTTGIVDRIFGGPNPTTIASASLESMRAQNRLIAFVARYVSVVDAASSSGLAALSARSAPDPARRRALRARSVEARSPTTSLWDGVEPYAQGPAARGRDRRPRRRSQRGPGIWRGRRPFGADQCQPAARPDQSRAGRRRPAQAGARRQCRCASRGRRRGRRSSAASRCRCSPPASRT